ncbi:MAG: histidine phosphatase family protein [Anaerolineales bacterium]
MNHLLLVKHSLPEIVPAIPASQWKLSAAGQSRCEPLAERIAPYLPDVVISSSEPKAVETAQIVAGKIDKPFRTFEGLHEHDRAGVGFMDRKEFESKVLDFFKYPDRLVLGRETAGQAYQRFSKALLSVEAEYPDKNLAVVSHGTVMTLFIEKMVGLEPFSFWKRLDCPALVVLSLPDHGLITTFEHVG